MPGRSWVKRHTRSGVQSQWKSSGPSLDSLSSWGSTTCQPLMTTGVKIHPHLCYAPIADRISRQRFRDISRYLHFVDNDHLAPRGDPSYDWLGKVRPLIEHLSERFEDVYKPTQNLAVDEAMIKFQGRSSLKQYMPMKPVKRGIKVWVLGDSSNEYFSKFKVYTGKQEAREVGLGEHVVKTLTRGLEKKNHHVFFDNFFTSVNLLEDLEKDGIYGCGTVRRHRKGLPSELKNPGLKKRYCYYVHACGGSDVYLCGGGRGSHTCVWKRMHTHQPFQLYPSQKRYT